MKQPVRGRPAATATVVILILAIAATGCDGSYTMVGTLTVDSVYYDNLSGLPSTLQFALSDKPDPEGGYKAYTAAVPVADATSSAGPSFEVAWEAKDRWATSREFWLLVAEDSNATSVIDSGDAILPSIRVVLSSGSTTTISGLAFDTASTPLGVLTYDPGVPKYIVRLFMSNPGAIDAATPVRLRFGTGPNLSDGNVAINFAMAITDPDLATDFFVQGMGVANGIAIFDFDGSGLTTTAVDWVTAPDPATAPVLVSDNSWMLWPGMLAP